MVELPVEAEKICPEVFGDKSWYFHEKDCMYYKIYDHNKEVYARIGGHNLPNPFDLEGMRLKQKQQLQKEGKDTTGMRIECTTVTHTLWKHWHKYKEGI